MAKIKSYSLCLILIFGVNQCLFSQDINVFTNMDIITIDELRKTPKMYYNPNNNSTVNLDIYFPSCLTRIFHRKLFKELKPLSTEQFDSIVKRVTKYPEYYLIRRRLNMGSITLTMYKNGVIQYVEWHKRRGGIKSQLIYKDGKPFKKEIYYKNEEIVKEEEFY